MRPRCCWANPAPTRSKAALGGSPVGGVNSAEVISHHAKFGPARHDIEAPRPPPFRLASFHAAPPCGAGTLRPAALKHGLSPGDRYCLALSKVEGVPAPTTERRWPEVADAAWVNNLASWEPENNPCEPIRDVTPPPLPPDWRPSHAAAPTLP